MTAASDKAVVLGADGREATLEGDRSISSIPTAAETRR